MPVVPVYIQMSACHICPASLVVLSCTHLEVIRSCTQELVADMKGAAAVNAAEVALTGFYTPGFVANIYEDLQATLASSNAESLSQVLRRFHH